MSSRRPDAAAVLGLPTDTNSVSGDFEAGSSDERGEPRELPTPAERVSEFRELFPERAGLPLTHRVRTVREDYAIEHTSEFVAQVGPDETTAGRQVDRRLPMTWGQAVEQLAESHEDTRRTTVNLERGRPGHRDYATHSVSAENRWMADYQKRYFAQLKGWLRELLGGERPSGGETEPAFEDPHVVLLTRTASAVPDGERLAPVDHATEVLESWEPVYHTLRNTLRAKGYELGEDWQYERRVEPHTGDRGDDRNTNAAYAHEHTIVVVDGAVEPEDFGAVLERHVEVCEPASADAHEPADAVEVKEPGDLQNIAAYVADYAGIEPVDLLEREAEYIGFAAAVTAANLRTRSRSDAAKHAATADACKQRAEIEGTDQEVDHGETVVPAADGARHRWECVECGSPHGIDQDQTLTEHRVDTADVPAIAADGGVRADREEQLRSRWSDATAAAAGGEKPQRAEFRERLERFHERYPDLPPPELAGKADVLDLELAREVVAGYDPGEVVGFETIPSWDVTSVTVGESEYPARSGNGVNLVSVQPDRNTLRKRVLSLLPDGLCRCPCGVVAADETMVSHLFTHITDQEKPEVVFRLAKEIRESSFRKGGRPPPGGSPDG